jgi:tetratricopeptide (TPR) repeat protein
MISRRVLAVLSLTIGIFVTQEVNAAQEDQKPEVARKSSPPPSIEEIRQAYSQRRDDDVIVLADQALHEITLKGDADQRTAELHFWRGASLRRLGRHKEARVALEESKTRGFNKAELHLELALVRRSLGDSEGAELDYHEAERVVPSDLEKQDRLIDRWNHDGKDEPRFKLTLTPQAGWDSNIVGLDPNTPLTQGNVRADSSYVGAFLDLQYYLVRNNHQILELEYQNMTRDYPESSKLSFMENLLKATGRQPLNEWADFEVRASLEEAFMRDIGHYRTERMIGAGLILFPWHDLQTRIFGDWTNGNYYQSTPPIQDRGGDIYRVGVEFAYDLGRGWAVSPYFSFNKYSARGNDYVSDGWETGLTVRPEEFLGLKVSGTLMVSEQDYANLNSMTNFTEKRKDHIVQFTLTVVFKQIERLIGYAPGISVTFVRHESNIGAFSYHQWNPMFELGINVLSF